jgi:hypothetical protein
VSTRAAVGYEITKGGKARLAYASHDGYLDPPNGLGWRLIKALKAKGAEAFFNRFVDGLSIGPLEPEFYELSGAFEEDTIFESVREAVDSINWVYVIDSKTRTLTVLDGDNQATVFYETITEDDVLNILAGFAKADGED